MAQQVRALPTVDLIPGTYVAEGDLIPEILYLPCLPPCGMRIPHVDIHMFTLHTKSIEILYNISHLLCSLLVVSAGRVKFCRFVPSVAESRTSVSPRPEHCFSNLNIIRFTWGLIKRGF